MIITEQNGKAVAVIGSRSFTNEELLFDYLTERRNKIKIIVTGGCNGPDSMSVKWATKFGKPYLVFPALWRDPFTGALDRGSGFKRNKYIIENSDIVIAFWDKKSKGTANSIEIAKRLGKPVQIIGFIPESKKR
jgi:hypothetical protein